MGSCLFLLYTTAGRFNIKYYVTEMLIKNLVEKSEFFYLIQIFRVGWNFNRRRWETFQTPQAHLNITSEL